MTSWAKSALQAARTTRRSSVGWALLLSLSAGCGSYENDRKPAVGNDPVLIEGEQIVKANCKVCHAQAINGAPILGNAKMWADRAPKGVDTLAANAVSGFGLMPAKGGNDSLTNDEVKSAITYMLSLLPEQ